MRAGTVGMAVAGIVLAWSTAQGCGGGSVISAGSGTGSGGGTTTSLLCIPGAQVGCACPGGSAGVQVCAPDGNHLLPCQCDAGSGGASTSTSTTTSTSTSTT